MTKQEELDKLRKFIASLPIDTYLYNALITFEKQFEYAIQNDFSWACIQSVFTA